MKNCIQCDSRLFGTVSFCPFCGHATGSTPATVTLPKVEADAGMSETTPRASAPQPPTPVTPPAIDTSASSSTRNTSAAPIPQVKPPKHTQADAIRKPAVASVSKAPETHQPKPTDKPKTTRKFLPGAAIAVVVLVVLIGLIGHGRNKQEIACDQQVDAGTKLVQSGDLAGAAEQSRLAAASCTGSRSSKATELQATLTAAQAAKAVHAKCARAYDVVSSRLNEGRLNGAINALNQLPPSCSDSSETKQLRDQIDQASAAADATEQNVRTAIAAGDAVAALAAVQDLVRLDRFRATLPALRTQIAGISTAKPVEQGVGTNGATASFSNQPATGAATQPPAIARPATQTAQPAAPAYNNQAALIQQFLSDAQTALAQSRFDAAKTYLDSARRMDPRNPQIDALARAIQNREHEVLQNETSIK